MTPVSSAPARPGLDSGPGLLAGSLDSDRPALVAADGSSLHHGELRARVADRAASWGPARRLVLVEGGRTVDHVVNYLAALEHGHATLVVPAGRDHSEVLERWQPDIVALSSGTRVRREESAHTLHPDLSLLLSTSGTTGSPKLVRLSSEAVASNAAAIAGYLGLAADDNAMCSLPLHYCYGLSVLHSHLLSGAAVTLTDASVVDPCFWSLAREVGATSVAGVPHTFDLLDRSPFATSGLPTLRRITQAGGRLAPDSVRAWAARGQRDGWDLVVMYGATEATARMSFLPPELALERAGSIGRAIPGGHLRIEPLDEVDEPGVGELVYSGPNVMMGYALTPRDLARGGDLDELRTGDLAREVDGLFEVVGRRNRHAKVFGLRIDLDRVDRHLAADDHRGATTVATDGTLHVFLPHGRRAGEAAASTAAFCGLPASAVATHVLPDLPRTSNDKVDLRALTRLAVEREAAAARQPSGAPARPDVSVAEEVRRTFARILGRPDLGAHESFVDAGGDSLSYLELATALEQVLDRPLPSGWHLVPCHELAAQVAPERSGSPGAAPRTDAERRTSGAARARSGLDTLAVLRTVAILAIVASHVDLIDAKGGAHLLLLLAGFNMARFQLGATGRARRVRNLVSGLAQVVVTSVLWVGTVSVFTRAYDVDTVLLVNQLTGSRHWTDQWHFWFLEVLVWATVAVTLLMALAPVHRFERAHPYGFALVLLAVTALLRYTVVGLEAGKDARYMLPATAFLVALGWAAARADTGRRRALVLALALVLVTGFFGEPVREGIVLVGLAVVLYVDRLPCPRWAVRPVTTLAAASLSIYLTHWLVYPPLEDAGLPWLALAASLLVGLVHARAMRPLNRRVARGVDAAARRLRPAPHRAGGPVPGIRRTSEPRGHGDRPVGSPRLDTGSGTVPRER